MRDYMGYTEDKSTLIVALFRHKLVHLAQPNPSILHNGKIVSWRYEHYHTPNHLLLEDAPKDTKIRIKSDWVIAVDQIFSIGFEQFMEDIRDFI
jgi:hypothetical protein